VIRPPLALALAATLVGVPSSLASPRPVDGPGTGEDGAAAAPAADEGASRADDYVLSLGGERGSLSIPRAEKLAFRVRVSLSVVEAAVGTVHMETGVEPFRASLLLAAPEAAPSAGGAESAWARIHAAGNYTLYSMDATLETRVFPQAWPRFAHRFEQTGTENRRRELLLGERAGEPLSSYRNDSKTGAPKGSRVWKEPRERAVPAGTLDMLSAVYMARELVRDREREELRFPLLDKTELWEMVLSRGEERAIEVDAGRFEAVEILLEPRPYPGETVDEDVEETMERFEGLFGLKGSIRLWFEARTGVPLRVAGDLPVGPVTLGIEVSLKSYRGTPAAFVPLAEEAGGRDGAPGSSGERGS